MVVCWCLQCDALVGRIQIAGVVDKELLIAYCHGSVDSKAMPMMTDEEVRVDFFRNKP